MSRPPFFIQRLPLSLRFALRDLLGDPKGFGVFIACIVIGVAAIAGVNGLSHALERGLAREGRTILGGDLSFNFGQRELSSEERDYLTARGRLDEILLMRAMTRLEPVREDSDPAMIEIKAVDPATYPLFGALETSPPLAPAVALAQEGDAFGLVADPMLLARLDAKVGDRLAIGPAHFVIRAALAAEPDKLAGGIGYGPRVIVSRAGLAATGLLQEGSIIRRFARLALPDAPSDDAVTRAADAANAALPRAGWDIRKRDSVSPQFTRNLERFSQLLTLVALTALVAGGAGVANAVQGLIERKRASFAILQALGAPASRVFAIALVEVLLMTALAIVIGLALGATIPYFAAEALRRAIELPVTADFDPPSLALAAFYGLLVALVFSLAPLGRAHDIPVAALLRGDADAGSARTPLPYLVAAAGAMLALVVTVMLSAGDRRLAGAFIGCVLAAFLLLRLVAGLAMRAARALPRARDARLRLAQSNIARPGSLAPTLVISTGVTVTLLVALALVEGAIHAELARSGSGEIPRFYFVDVAKADSADFARFLEEQEPSARIDRMPMMRGRIVAVKGVRVEKLQVGQDAVWALEGDRGVTFSAAPPKGARIIEGAWWNENEKARLVSMESKVAAGMGLSIGDEITVNVLGREITARVANLRKVEWRTLAINFVMVFSPATFAGAPYSDLYTIGYDGEDADARDARLARATAKRFPAVAAIRVKEALETVDKIADQLALAARAAASLAIATALLALGSAIAAGQRARLHDAVVLKTLGATRRWLIAAYILEFAVLAAAACGFALLAGAAAAYGIVEGLMTLPFVFPADVLAATTLGALGATLALGLAGTWTTLSRKPGPELRSL